MQERKLSLQKWNANLYDEFDSLLCEGGNTVSVLLGFAQLINNRMLSIWQMRSSSVNTKFLNSLPPEWSKFVTDVKLARDLHTTNYDQLYSNLEQHEFPQLGLSLAVLVFNQGDDPIAYLNKEMDFLTAIASSRVTVQQVQGRQGQSYAGNSYKGHMARQFTQPKRPRNTSWVKEKLMLAEAVKTTIPNIAAF
ncbi:hypothetical protein Tco_1401728 [Tanacetum coccineum]